MKIFKASVIVSAILLCASALVPVSAEDISAVSVYKNGEELSLDNSAFIQSGNVYLPLRELLNKLSQDKIEIIWNEDKSITLNGTYTKPNDETALSCAEFQIGSDELKITRDGKVQNLSLSAPPILVDNKTYVPYNLCVLLDGNIYAMGGFETVISADDELENELQKSLSWAQALKTRDGKPRYDIMSEDMQKKFVDEQKALVNDDENWNYVIGFSSPQVISYDIALSGDTAYISYHLTDSSDETYIIDEKITFENNGDNLIVSEYETIE